MTLAGTSVMYSALFFAMTALFDWTRVFALSQAQTSTSAAAALIAFC